MLALAPSGRWRTARFYSRAALAAWVIAGAHVRAGWALNRLSQERRGEIREAFGAGRRRCRRCRRGG